MKVFVTVPYQSDDNCPMCAYGWFDFDCKPAVGDDVEISDDIHTMVSSTQHFLSENKDGDPVFDFAVTTDPIIGQKAWQFFEAKGLKQHWDIDAMSHHETCPRECIGYDSK